MDSTTQFITLAIILLALIAHLILTQASRRRQGRTALRSIAAYETLPLLVGESIEADRPLHLSFGSASLGTDGTLIALSAAELFYQVAQRAATGMTPPIITLSNTSVLPLAQDTLRRAYATRGRIERYQGGAARWYAGGGQTLAFAAALTSMVADEQVTSNILAGSYGAELALILDTTARRNQMSIATSDQLEGQAIAFAMSERPLIGEEIFSAGAYLEGKPNQVATIASLDILRWLVIFMILIPTINVLTEGELFRLIFGGR